MRRAAWIGLAALAPALAACSGESDTGPEPGPVSGPAAPSPREPGAGGEAGDPLEIEQPRPRIRNVLRAEVLSTELVDWLGALGDRILIRDFEALAPSLAEDFRGHGPFAVGLGDEERLPHGARRRALEVGGAEVLDRAGWLDSLRARLAPLRRVELCHWGLGSAEFLVPVDGSTWGAVDLVLHLVGMGQDGARTSLTASFRGRVSLEAGVWRLDRLRLVEGELATVGRPWFRNVSRSSGVHHEGIRYGQPGNDSDAWNGVACGDVDGDGRFDLFVPGSRRSFLYRNRGDGTFVEEAEARGLAGDAAGTGAVFFDFDADGDQDLAVAHVGWRELDLSPGGDPLRLYANDGAGRFTEVTDSVGLDVRLPAYSLVAFDADGDGWTDLFVCGYGRMAHEVNDSWILASNGAPNALLRNTGGRFEDVTRAAGLDDTRWTYSAAACDFDADGDQDLYVGNNFGPNRLWRNAGDGTFEDAASELGVDERGLTMGVSWADLDGDARLDLFMTQPSSHAGHRILDRLRERDVTGPIAILDRMAAGNALFLGSGAAFVDRGEASGAAHAGWAWGHACVDLDLDGALDVYCVNGFVTGDFPQDT